MLLYTRFCIAFDSTKKKARKSNGIPLLDGSSIHRGREGLRLTEGYDAQKLSSQKRFISFSPSSKKSCVQINATRFLMADAAFQTRQRTPSIQRRFFEQHPRQKKETESIEKKPFHISNAPTSKAPFNVRRDFHKQVSIEFRFFLCSVRLKPT